MSLYGRLGLAAIAAAAGVALWKLFQFAYHQLTSPLRRLRGPRSKGFMHGNIRDMRSPDRPEFYEELTARYGTTMKYKGFFNRNELFTVDARAVNHILTHSDDYEKQPATRYNLSQIFGQGLLLVEGAQHRQQRRIMNPAFGPGQIRALTEIFFDKAILLRNLWSSEINKNSEARAAAGVPIDVVPWLTQMTLDVIGLAGFNYDLGALNADGKSNELSEALSTMFSESQRFSVFPTLQAWIPPLRLIPTERTRKIRAARRTMAQIGKELITNAKAVALAAATENGEIEKSSLHGRDLLSLLVKANMATDIPESQKLSDEEVLAQVPTFFIAGHETTSTAVTWALYAMTQAPKVQTELRKELLSLDTDRPSMDELMALPYLDMVIRETLRVYPPVPFAGRIAMKDDVLPVETSFIDKHGVVQETIRVSKGDVIMIPIMAINHSKTLWGPDAHEFRPERWTQIPENVSHVPGVWGHQLTFLGGQRGCIGYRFSLVEIKAILFTLVRTFDFALGVPTSEIGSKAAIVQRPVLRTDDTNKAQLPLLVRPYQEV